MSIWTKIFGKKTVSMEEARLWLEELERLADLPYFLPASERLKMVENAIPSYTIGEGGVLHDRFKTVMNRVLSRGVEYVRSHGDEQVRITPAWECMPSVMLVPCDFQTSQIEGGDIIQHVKSTPGRDYVILATKNLNVREREPARQMQQFFKFKDEPRLAMSWLAFCASVFVRASFLLLPHGEALETHNLERFLVTCGSQAMRLGYRCERIK